ncbi:MAG TPA: hypothetical protein VFY35_03775 [Burkholderiaceae bacterium]|nr:hypothetical protein [Burkholderiaceae bacterium]
MQCVDLVGTALQVAPCGPGKLALLTYEEASLIAANPLFLDLESAGLITAAIASVWAIAYVFRVLVRHFNDFEPPAPGQGD